jgi:hypothetical protein
VRRRVMRSVVRGMFVSKEGVDRSEIRVKNMVWP